jgi:hypothetical protein
MIRMRGDGPHCGNRRRRAFRRLDGTMDIPEHGAAAPTRNGPRRPRPVRGPHGQATPGTAAAQHLRGQPFPRWALRVDGLARGPEIHRGPRRPLELAGARAARRQAAQIDWPDAERLDLEQSIQRVQTKYPDFPRDEVEEFLLNWVDSYDPENYSQAQLDELDSLTERWVADHLRMAKASKKQKRTRHS